MRIGRILGVWAMIAGLLFWNGALAIGVLKPLLGNEAGEMMQAFIALTIVFGVSKPFLTEWPEMPRAQAARIGILWMVLTLLFEIGFGHAATFGGPSFVPTYEMWDGAFWPLVILAVTTAPIAWLPRTPVAIGRVTK